MEALGTYATGLASTRERLAHSVAGSFHSRVECLGKVCISLEILEIGLQCQRLMVLMQGPQEGQKDITDAGRAGGMLVGMESSFCMSVGCM